jgi:hypothetical protein
MKLDDFFSHYMKVLLVCCLANLYKIFYFLFDAIYDTPYKIMPWSDPKNQIVSKSNPLWLLVHLLLAVAHTIVTYKRIKLIQQRRKNKFLDSLFNALHYVFIAFVFINSFNFVGLPVPVALLVNFGTSALLQLFKSHYEKSNDEKLMYWYYVVLTSPVLFQIPNVLLNFKTFVNFFTS